MTSYSSLLIGCDCDSHTEQVIDFPRLLELLYVQAHTKFTSMTCRCVRFCFRHRTGKVSNTHAQITNFLVLPYRKFITCLIIPMSNCHCEHSVLKQKLPSSFPITGHFSHMNNRPINLGYIFI